MVHVFLLMLNSLMIPRRKWLLHRKSSEFNFGEGFRYFTFLSVEDIGLPNG
jgi:hypothetical protein